MTRLKNLTAKTALTAIFVTLGMPGLTADAQGRYTVEGPGALQCSAFLQLQPASQEYAITIGYVSGYLGASNALSADTFDVTPWQTLELSVFQIRQFCESNPEASLATGLEQYLAFLLPDRIRENEEKVSLQVDDSVLQLYPSVIDRIDRSLAERGFGSGKEPLDGLRDFQTSIGVEATGLPDQITLLQLFTASR